MKVHTLKALGAVVGGAALAGGAAADGFIGLDDFSGSEDVITFNDTEMGDLDNPADIGFGITVANNGSGTGNENWRGNTDWGGFFDNIPGASLGRALADSWGTSDLLFELETGMNRFGMLLSTGTQTTWQIEVFDTNGNLLDSGEASMPNDSEAVFVGYESLAAPIGSFRVFELEDNGQITLMDDVRFEVIPAPGAIALLGLAGLTTRRRRR